MHFFQNPLASGQPKAGSGHAKALSLFHNLCAKIKAQAPQAVIYHTEVKKLCLAVEGAEEVRARLAAVQKEEIDLCGILIKEVQNQIRAFALIRMANDPQVEQAYTQANEEYTRHTGPGPSRTERFCTLLRNSIKPFDEDEFHTGMGIQPITHVLVHNQEDLTEFGGLFPHVLDQAFKTLYESNKVLAQLESLS